jgi:hypothetical protein
MTVAFDAVTTTSEVTQVYETLTAPTDRIRVNHTPSGTPKAALVLVTTENTLDVENINYGAAAMTEVLAINSGVGACAMACYLLNDPAAGAQDVDIFVPGNNYSMASVITLTADGDVELVDSDSLIATADAAASLALGGRSSYCVQLATESSARAIVAKSGWTGNDVDFVVNSQSANVTFAMHNAAVRTADLEWGWTNTISTHTGMALAFAEVVGGGGGPGAGDVIGAATRDVIRVLTHNVL